MAAKLISLSLYDDEIRVLDALVAHAREKSFTPTKVNRSTVLRDLILNSARDNIKAKEACFEDKGDH